MSYQASSSAMAFWYYRFSPLEPFEHSSSLLWICTYSLSYGNFHLSSSLISNLSWKYLQHPLLQGYATISSLDISSCSLFLCHNSIGCGFYQFLLSFMHSQFLITRVKFKIPSITCKIYRWDLISQIQCTWMDNSLLHFLWNFLCIFLYMLLMNQILCWLQSIVPCYEFADFPFSKRNCALIPKMNFVHLKYSIWNQMHKKINFPSLI